MTLTLWIGDADQYIHQQRVVLNSKAPGPGATLLDVVVDFTITYRDFGAAVNITAPPNAVPYTPAPLNPAPAGPPAVAPSPVELAQTLLTAFNNADEPTIRKLVAPGTQFVDDPGTSFAVTQSLDDWLAESRSRTVHVVIAQVTQTAPDMVALDITITGSAIPALPHPYTGRITLTLSNGLVTHFLFLTSAQTRNDLGALPQPGMPKSGAAAPAGLLAGLGLGLLCLGLGLAARRAARSARSVGRH
jgi:hypothetical protein